MAPASRPIASRIADVRSVVAGARALARRSHELVPAIVASTGLSPAGVELAFARHLELDPTDADLERLVASATEAPRIVVILSANVFVGALRAVALARAASDDVVVRPSRRDPAFARALVDEVRDPCLRIDELVDVADVVDGELHVYGRDETIAAIRARVRDPERVRLRGHGSGMGVAWISASGELSVAAKNLADDVVAFDQRGCLSPRVAFVEGTASRANDFADALHAELERVGEVVPRGLLPAEERAESGRYVATMTYAGRAIVGSSHAIGVAPAGAPIVVAPPYRHVHVLPAPTLDDARHALAPLMRAVVTVGSDDTARAGVLAPAWARISELGRMQRPPLDGPVDRRT